MTVQELITKLEKMPSDAKILMYDGWYYYTPFSVYITDEQDVIID